MNASTIIAYIFRSDIYCPRCITSVLYATDGFDGWSLADGATPMSTEDDLDETADAFGFNRSDETTYDSNAFPKVVFYSPDYETYQCAKCMELLIEDEQDEQDVHELDDDEHPAGRTTCGTCGRSWDDDVSTSTTPVPAGRCPFEYLHDEQDDDDDANKEPISTVNLGAQCGDIGPGDTVICGGDYATVTRVSTRAPGHDVTAIRSDLTAIIVETTSGARYLGADRAWIGSDLRMHWTR